MEVWPCPARDSDCEGRRGNENSGRFSSALAALLESVTRDSSALELERSKGIRLALPLSALEVLASRAGVPSALGAGLLEVSGLGLAPSSPGVGALELSPALPACAVSALEEGVFGALGAGLNGLVGLGRVGRVGRVGAGITRLTSDPGGRMVGSGVLESTRGGALGAAGAMVMGRPGIRGTGVTFKLEGGPETVGAICLVGALEVCCTVKGASCAGVGLGLAV